MHQRAYRARHPERIVAARNALTYCATHPETRGVQGTRRCTECWRAYHRDWRAKKPELSAAIQQRYVKRNPEKRRATQLKWQRANREKLKACPSNQRPARRLAERRQYALHRSRILAKNAKRRALRHNSTIVPFTVAEMEARMSMFGNRCWMCGGPQETIDHVKPLARGGAHVLANLRPACETCNCLKSDTWPFAAVKE